MNSISENRFYVYGLFDRGVPFYIGKGTGDRMRSHNTEARAGSKLPVHNKIRKLAYEHEQRVLADGLSSPDALELEELVVTTLGRRDKKTGSLLNLTDGGDGHTGCTPSMETRLKRSASLKGRTHTPEARKKLSDKLMGHTVSQETRDKISATKRDRPRTEKQRASCIRNGLRAKGRKHTAETKAKISAKNKGRKVSSETRAKISISTKRGMALAAKRRQNNED